MKNIQQRAKQLSLQFWQTHGLKLRDKKQEERNRVAEESNRDEYDYYKERSWVTGRDKY